MLKKCVADAVATLLLLAVCLTGYISNIPEAASDNLLEISGGGLIGKHQQWDCQIGNSIRAKLSTKTPESTGVIAHQYINKIY